MLKYSFDLSVNLKVVFDQKLASYNKAKQLLSLPWNWIIGEGTFIKVAQIFWILKKFRLFTGNKTNRRVTRSLTRSMRVIDLVSLRQDDNLG